MRLHDLYDEFQSQTVFNLPVTALCAGNVLPPVERIQERGGDPAPVIRNHTEAVAVFLSDRKNDFTALRIVDNAVADQIVQHPLLFGVYSVAVTVLTGTIAGLGGLSSTALIQQGVQTVVAAFNTCLVCMPIILIFGQMRGAYLGGSLLTFFLGYCILFFKSGFLLSAYPFSAALVLAGFDMQAYNGATQSPRISLALAGMAAVIVLTLAILSLSHPVRKAGNDKKGNAKKGRRRRRRA